MFETALIVIDMQRDYFPGGKAPLPDMDRAVERAAVLVRMFRAGSLPVIHVRHIEKDPSIDFLREGTEGAEIDERVAPQGQDLLITKHHPNAFRDTTLEKVLHVLGAKELVFCGAMSNLCIDASVRAACDLGYRCVVVEDACAASNLTFHNFIPAVQVHGAFMAALASAYGEVVDLNTFLARFTGD